MKFTSTVTSALLLTSPSCNALGRLRGVSRQTTEFQSQQQEAANKNLAQLFPAMSTDPKFQDHSSSVYAKAKIMSLNIKKQQQQQVSDAVPEKDVQDEFPLGPEGFSRKEELKKSGTEMLSRMFPEFDAAALADHSSTTYAKAKTASLLQKKQAVIADSVSYCLFRGMMVLT